MLPYFYLLKAWFRFRKIITRRRFSRTKKRRTVSVNMGRTLRTISYEGFRHAAETEIRYSSQPKMSLPNILIFDEVKRADDELSHDELPRCYFPTLDRNSVVALLSRFPIGTYLVRPSSDASATYTLSVRAETQIFNMRVHRNSEGQLQLDSGRNQKLFRTIQELLNFYGEEGRRIWIRNMDEYFKMMNPLDASSVDLNSVLRPAVVVNRGALDTLL